MVANLPAWEDPTTPLGPYIETDPKREVVRPRNVQLIPGYYATLHLRGEILTSKIITKKNFKVTNIFTEVPEENHQILSFFK